LPRRYQTVKRMRKQSVTLPCLKDVQWGKFMTAISSGAKPVLVTGSQPLSGQVTVPSDKSMSHRAFMLASLALGESRIRNALDAEDVAATRQAMMALGANITADGDDWLVSGVGVGNFREPDQPLDFGNAGTGSRLTMGLISSSPITAFFTGDASLHSRPMGRVLKPLARIGATHMARQGGRMPLALQGTHEGLPLTHDLDVASAQVKSAILLSALNILGRTTVIEKAPTRDHTEKMLEGAGVVLEYGTHDGRPMVSLVGPQQPEARDWEIPADPSSAAFPMVAALLVPGSDIIIENVMMNPHRTGLITSLQEMGADITIVSEHVEGEHIASLRVRHSQLHGIEVPASRAPSMIDEYPILAVAAAHAEGETIMRGLDELRVKESDRLQLVHDHLVKAGVRAHIMGDDLFVTGGHVAGGMEVDTHLDHRIAMSFFVLGLVSEEPIKIDDMRTAETSFPGFADLMMRLGAKVSA